MAKVFRLFEDMPMTHWQARGTDYSKVIIEKIQSPDGDQSASMPTSIPSPFARLNLFETAFHYFDNLHHPLAGLTTNHKLVSDCLDLLELLYNKDSIDGELQVKVWDKQRDLQKLTQAHNPKHQLLGRTLDLFLKQDEDSFNFDQLNRLYIFYYNHHIIGATSPKTMVFTTANNLAFAQINLNDRVLFTSPAALKDRDEDFIFYLYALFKRYQVLAQNMPEMQSYIRRTVKEKTDEDRSFMNRLQQLEDNFLDSKEDMEGPDYKVEIFQVPFRNKSLKNVQERIEKESQFLIASTKPITGKRPMVLNTNGTLGLLDYLYEGIKWDVNTKVPAPKEQQLDLRVLPGKDIKYPYLTVDDFLEPEIFETPYLINKDAYFDGNYQNKSSRQSLGYTLPLKKLFFEYFTEEDLINRVVAGKKMIEILRVEATVNVVLRIPIDQGRQFIELTKKYDEEDMLDRKSGIIKCHKYFQLFPNVITEQNPNYYLQVIDQNNLDYSQRFQMLFDDKTTKYRSVKSKLDSRNGSIYNSYYFRVKENFQALRFQEDNAKCNNYLIPLWQNSRHNGGAFTFSIDFGTSNTHVEYLVNRGEPKPLDLDAGKNGFANSFYPLDTRSSEEHALQNLKDLEFIPENISSESNYNFPIRSVIFDYNNFDASTYQSILDYNIGFTYEKVELPLINNVRPHTNLKWVKISEHEEAEAWMRSYLEQLIIMCKTKVLAERGDLQKTRFTWTYTQSYGKFQINRITNLLQDLVEIHFGPNIDIIKICESIAPFYSIASSGKILGTSNTILSLDIGGGTIDSVVYQNRKVVSISSELFGANYLYRAGYTTDYRSNGFHRLGEKFIAGLLNNKGSAKLKTIQTEILKSGKIEDIISFYFSLEKEKDLQDFNNISFNKFLSNHDNERIVFLFYLASIIYFNVVSMKIRGLAAPSYLTFSGNGSRFLSIIDQTKNKDSIIRYANALFSAIYQDEEALRAGQVRIVIPENPKELTAKGAINLLEEGPELIEELSIHKLDEKFISYLGDREGTIISPSNPIKYGDLEHQFNETVFEGYADFVQLFLAIPGFNYKNEFGIEYDISRKFKDILLDKTSAMEFLETGIAERKKVANTDDTISDNLSFFIIRGMLGQMLNTLLEDDNK